MNLDGGTDRSRTLYAVLAITALSLVVRLVGLGSRIFHWDEGRVGYWILRYRETGEFFYRPIIHGPFLPIVNDYLFAILPASDFAARLPVAFAGGLLPLAAWLLRDRLRREEIVALALLLAANPLMVYYSRFMRNDVLVAAFSFVALACLVRAIDTDDLRYLYPAAAAMALAFTTKENALLYVVSWLGAGVLLLDHGLFRAAARGRSAGTVVRDEWPAAIADRLRRYGDSARDGGIELGAHVSGSLVVFVLVIIFFYAPRPDLWQTLGNPLGYPELINEATYGAAEKFYSSWIGGSHQDHEYFPFLEDYLETLAYGAPIVLVFGAIGFLLDRYRPEGYRGLVTFATYWGVSAIIGYPIASDIQAPWATIHAVVPLAIPAAVGLAFVFREGRRALSVEREGEGVGSGATRDLLSVGIAALVLLGAGGTVAGANVAYMDADSDEHAEVLQWAQPETELKETLETVRPVVQHNEGTDVLFVGTKNPGGDQVEFYLRDESSVERMPPGGPGWHDRLPLPWYLERYGAEVNSSAPDASLDEALRDAPPVVICYDFDRDEVEPRLEGYAAYTHDFKLHSEEIVVFVDESALAAATGSGGD